jgi:hypothetical protein
MQHFIWLAAQAGVEVIAPDESDVLQPPPLYGYADTSAMGRKLAVRERELQARADNLRAIRDRHNRDIIFLEGALEDIDYQRKTWVGYDPRSDGKVVLCVESK